MHVFIIIRLKFYGHSVFKVIHVAVIVGKYEKFNTQVPGENKFNSSNFVHHVAIIACMLHTFPRGYNSVSDSVCCARIDRSNAWNSQNNLPRRRYNWNVVILYIYTIYLHVYTCVLVWRRKERTIEKDFAQKRHVFASSTQKLRRSSRFTPVAFEHNVIPPFPFCTLQFLKAVTPSTYRSVQFVVHYALTRSRTPSVPLLKGLPKYRITMAHLRRV